MALKLSKKWTRLNLEKLNERVNPDATFRWEFLAAPAAPLQAGLYFRVDGDQSNQLIADRVTVANDNFGGLNIQIDTINADDLASGVPAAQAGLTYMLHVDAGEIALAQNVVGGTFRGVHVVTYDGDDTVSGAGLPFAMFIEGGAGNDSLSGGNIADRIDGGTGGPVVGGVLQANDTINGSSGSDVLIGGDGNDVINGGTGNDNIDAGDGANTVDAGSGNNTVVVSGNSNNTITGTTGADTVTVTGNGNNTVNTGDGNDTVNITGNGNNTVNAGTGNDTVTITGTGNNTVNGDDGNDTITTGSGNDTVNGGAGDDTVNAGDGNNTVNGNDGNDTITTGTGTDNVSGGLGNDTISTDGGNDTVSGGDGNDNIDGGVGNDTLNGDAGNDTVAGGDGNDAVTGGAGADSLSGGNGDDVVNADTDDVALSGGAGTDTLNLTGTGTLVPVIDNQPGTGSGFEVYSLPGAANITFAPSTADFAANTLPAGVVLNAGDTLDFRNAPPGQTIDLNNLPFGLGSGSGVNANGSPGADVITGTSGNDRISGADGNDVVNGGAGNDTLSGGLGNDVVLGGDGDDTLVIEWNGGNLNAADIFLGQGGTDTLAFSGVPDSDGNAANGIQPSAANLTIIYNYIAQQIAAGKMDWNTGSSADNPTILFLP